VSELKLGANLEEPADEDLGRLLPIRAKRIVLEPQGCVRVLWASSIALEAPVTRHLEIFAKRGSNWFRR
jgi:hypothetical protein